MPAAIAVPLISSAIAGGASIAGGAMAARGANKAAKAQTDAATQALDFEKEQYRNEQSRLEPYRQQGGQAYAQLGRMFGLEGPSAPASGTFSFQRPMTGGMVKIRHPRTGEIRDVPAAQAEILIRDRGGLRVG